MTRTRFAACVLAAVAVGVVTGSEKGWSVAETAAVGFGWVRDLNAPARNPYQQAQFVGNCPSAGGCDLAYPIVPPGKTLIVTHASCQVDVVPGGYLGNALLGSVAGREAIDSLVYTTQNPAGTAYSINTMTNLYYTTGEQPEIGLITYNAGVSDGTCLLTGYYYP